MAGLWRRLFGRPEKHAPRGCILYTRQGCCLCDEAQAVLVAHGLEPQLVDIDQDETLRSRYNECVPVVEIDGRVRFRGHIDERLLRRMLKHRTR